MQRRPIGLECARQSAPVLRCLTSPSLPPNENNLGLARFGRALCVIKAPPKQRGKAERVKPGGRGGRGADPRRRCRGSRFAAGAEAGGHCAAPSTCSAVPAGLQRAGRTDGKELRCRCVPWDGT